MSNIGGTRREHQDFTKHVGLFEAKVIAINPTIEEYKEVLGIELPEDSKATEYLGESKDGNVYLRISIWVENIKSHEKQSINFFLEDKERVNKDETKKQYINSVGSCSWAEDPNNLPDWFSERSYRVAKIGEEELYDFLRTWLCELDYRNAETVLELEWKKLMRGNVKDLKDQIDGEWCGNVGFLSTIVTKEKDGEVKEYQNIYNKAFLSPYSLKNFRLVDYSDEEVLTKLKNKKTKELKPHEKFVLKITGEYGCKDFYILKDLKEYDPAENIVASDKIINDDDTNY